MPPKMVTCCICGELVSKRSTVFLGKERACRTHDGTLDVRDALERRRQKQLAADKIAEREKMAKRIQNHSHEYEPLSPRCWLCNEPGMHQQDYFSRVLIETEKYEMQHGRKPNFFNLDEMQEIVTGLDRCLFIVDYTKHKKVLSPLVHSKFYEAVRFIDQNDIGGLMFICAVCMDKHSLHDTRPQPESLKQLTSLSAIYDAFVKPKVRKIAATELAESN